MPYDLCESHAAPIALAQCHRSRYSMETYRTPPIHDRDPWIAASQALQSCIPAVQIFGCRYIWIQPACVDDVRNFLQEFDSESAADRYGAFQISFMTGWVQLGKREEKYIWIRSGNVIFFEHSRGQA